DRDPGDRRTGPGLFLEPHLDGLLVPRDVIAVAIEQGGDDREIVAIAVVRLAKLQIFQLHPRQYRDARGLVARLEELAVQLDGKLVQLLAREERLANFLFGRLQ